MTTSSMSISAENVSFSYKPSDGVVATDSSWPSASGSIVSKELPLHNVSFSLPRQSRTLLIGANGAGKTTLLKILAGKKLLKNGSVRLNERDPFEQFVAGVVYLGSEFVTNPIVRMDIKVSELIQSVGGDQFPTRRDALIDILDIDLNWRMHAVSDGQCRRVQLCMGLLKPWTFLFLDEVTTDLDILARSRFMSFLIDECESRDASVVIPLHYSCSQILSTEH